MEQVVNRIGVIDNGRLLREITLDEIRKQQTDYIEILTTNVERAVYLLEDKLHITNMKIIHGNRIRIYNLTHSQNAISKMLILHDIGLEEIQKHTSSLEDFFYKQINGGGQID
jgi:ABC-2 type transport system ATP-binding protein